jgi:uncharacterized protein YbjQ (UPF0145 family)
VGQPHGTTPGAWLSQLSAGDAALLRGTGFTPVGFVTGASVWSVGFQWGQGWRGKVGELPKGFYQLYPCPHIADRSSHVAGLGRYGGREGRWNTHEGHEPGINWEHTKYQEAVTVAFGSACKHMLDSATALRAHGVIDVRVEQRRGEGAGQLVEFSLTGTAVAHKSSPPLAVPFAAAVTVAERLELLAVGWAPAAVVMGGAAVEAERGCATRIAQAGMLGRLSQYSDAIDQARSLAVERLEDASRGFGESVLGCKIEEHFSSALHGVGAEVVVTGTAVRQSKKLAMASSGPRHVVKLGRR